MSTQSFKSIARDESSQTEPSINQQPTPADEWLTIAEVAAYLKLSRRTAWRWCKSGRLSAVKVGHQWRIAKSDLDAFIHRHGKLAV